MKERILALLGAGVSPALVASAVGCDPSYISQLMQDETFAFSVAEERCRDLEVVRARDGRYDSLEDKLLERLELLLPMMLKPRDVLHALQVMNQAKRRSQDLLANGANQTVVINNVVNLQLPIKTVRSFELNKNNEVISVGETALVPMPTSQLLKEMNSPKHETSPSKGFAAAVEELTTRKVQAQ